MAVPANHVEMTLPAVTSSLGGMRLQLAMDAADSGADLDVVEEIVLAASELASNVIRHAEDSEMTVRLGRTDSAWILDVSGADALARLDANADMPDPLKPDGRGLAIVHAVMDSVELVEVDDTRWIRCAIRR